MKKVQFISIAYLYCLTYTGSELVDSGIFESESLPISLDTTYSS